MEYTWETLSEGLRLCVTPAHKFGTDAFLLSDFAAPRRRDIVCDLGSGCGIVPALWFRQPADAPVLVYAVEIQRQAVEQMECAIKEGGLPAGRFLPMHADLRRLRGRIAAGTVDLVTCNPPYKAAGGGILSRSITDRIARHETLCSLDDICEAASYILRFSGRLCLCQRPERLADVIAAMRRHKIEPKRLRFVQQRQGSAPWLFLIEGKVGAKPFLQIEPPVIIEGDAGFSEELLHIYQKESNLVQEDIPQHVPCTESPEEEPIKEEQPRADFRERAVHVADDVAAGVTGTVFGVAKAVMGIAGAVTDVVADVVTDAAKTVAGGVHAAQKSHKDRQNQKSQRNPKRVKPVPVQKAQSKGQTKQRRHRGS